MKIPGLFDLQVNGYKSVDFCSAELTEDAFVYASRELIKNGTSLFLPTVITSSPEVYQRNLKLMVKAIVKAGLEEHIPGFHLEGPFISPEDGARGAHAKEWVSKPDTGLLDQMILWSENKIKLLTVAAEIPGMEMLCRLSLIHI